MRFQLRMLQRFEIRIHTQPRNRNNQDLDLSLVLVLNLAQYGEVDDLVARFAGRELLHLVLDAALEILVRHFGKRQDSYHRVPRWRSREDGARGYVPFREKRGYFVGNAESVEVLDLVARALRVKNRTEKRESDTPLVTRQTNEPDRLGTEIGSDGFFKLQRTRLAPPFCFHCHLNLNFIALRRAVSRFSTATHTGGAITLDNRQIKR